MKQSMSALRWWGALALLVSVIAVSGCTSRYVITTKMEQQLPAASSWSIGAITDKLPENFDPTKKPTLEDIDTFKEKLTQELQKIDKSVSMDASMTPTYEVQGGILDYKKGNGFLRFMFGFGAGAAKLIIELKVVDLKQSSAVFAGNFTGQVTDGMESGGKMWDTVAKDFAKAITKERKRLQAPATATAAK